MGLKILMLGFCVICLSACGVKKFDCPYNDGTSCKSLSEVNEMVNRGEHGKKKNEKNKSKIKENFFNINQSHLEQSIILPIDPKEPIRVPEKIVRIWLAPYESNDGTFHQQTFINTVVMPAQWMGDIN